MRDIQPRSAKTFDKFSCCFLANQFYEKTKHCDLPPRDPRFAQLFCQRGYWQGEVVPRSLDREAAKARRSPSQIRF